MCYQQSSAFWVNFLFRKQKASNKKPSSSNYLYDESIMVTKIKEEREEGVDV